MNRPRRIALATATALALVGTATGGALAAGGSDPQGKRALTQAAQTGTTQLVTVAAPSKAKRAKVQSLGLDVTESATTKGIDVVLHGAADAKTLKAAGFTWKVKVKDLEAQRRANARADKAYAASVGSSPLPSGQDHYRTLADYNREMRDLAAKNPTLVKPITLENKTVEGRTVEGIELTRNVANIDDGKPVFFLMGAHHAREWPSSEHTIEFAYDLLKNYATDARAKRIVDGSRLIFVPVVNPDGFEISRSATPRGDFSLFDYEMKRKNCRISENTPAAYTGGTCADNPAGRLRGTDLNRNYPGFWGGPGASASWSSDTYRGDDPGGEPESDNIRSLISQRQVTALITNHTFSNLVLRPPSLASTGLAPDEDQYRELGAMMTDANNYTNQASYQLYDTSGSTEDWSYWNTGGFGFTFEIGDEGFHPTYENAVVGEYLGLAPAAGAGRGGNREAYYRFADANLDAAYHSTITGKAPANRKLTIRKQFTSLTSPVIVNDADPTTTSEPIPYTDVLTSSYASKGGRFSWAVNPSTRPVVAGRGGRNPQAPAQPTQTLTNPAGVPAEGGSEFAPFDITGLPTYDNAKATVTVSWPGQSGDEALDWDVFVYTRNADGTPGELVAQAATLSDPEVAVLVDPSPGGYVVEVNNYAGGTAATDWTGKVEFANPVPPTSTGIKEAWVLSCTKNNGDVVGSREIVVDRGQRVDVGNACDTRKN